ncbi:MAG: DUF1320 domain-containing protein [Methanosarcinaceae archaeon]|nr:DUF1320 domain-containing protein [Methanosarcinaceae archaeon]
MAYSNIDDLKKYMRADIIRQLTDDNNTGEIDELVVDDVILQADTMIDSFLRGRYPVEITVVEDVPAMICDLSTKLAAYNLYRRNLILTLPESIAKDYKFCVDMLKQIQVGTISPFPSASEPAIFVTNKVAADKQYSPEKWATYD